MYIAKAFIVLSCFSVLKLPSPCFHLPSQKFVDFMIGVSATSIVACVLLSTMLLISMAPNLFKSSANRTQKSLHHFTLSGRSLAPLVVAFQMSHKASQAHPVERGLGILGSKIHLPTPITVCFPRLRNT